MENESKTPQDILAERNLRRQQREVNKREAAKTVPNKVGRPKTVQRRPGTSKDKPKKMGTGYRLTCEGCSGEKAATHLVTNNKDMYAVCPSCANKIESKREQSIISTYNPSVGKTNVPSSVEIEPLDTPCAGPSCRAPHPVTGEPKQAWTTKTKKSLEKNNKGLEEGHPNRDVETNYHHPATHIINIGGNETPACPGCAKIMKKDYSKKVAEGQIDPSIKSFEKIPFQTNRERYSEHMGEYVREVGLDPDKEVLEPRKPVSSKYSSIIEDVDRNTEYWSQNRSTEKFTNRPKSALWKLPLNSNLEFNEQGYEDMSDDSESGPKHLETSEGEALEAGGNINKGFSVKSQELHEIPKPDERTPSRAETLTSLFHLREAQEPPMDSAEKLAYRPDPESVSQQILHQRHKEEAFSRRNPRQRDIILHEAIQDIKNMPEDKERKIAAHAEAVKNQRKKIVIGAELLQSLYQEKWGKGAGTPLPGRDKNYIPGGRAVGSRNPKYERPAKTPEARQRSQDVNKMLKKYSPTGRKVKQFKAFPVSRQFGNIGENPKD